MQPGIVSPCPADESLEALAASGDDSDVNLRQHVRDCPSCRSRIDQIRANNAFLQRFLPLEAADAGMQRADSPPVTMPGYQLIHELHRGGQGVVYQAVQQSTGRTVAVKVMREGPFASPDERIRFEREVRLLASLRHPHIVAIHDSGTSAGCHFFVMDFVDGVPIDAFVRNAGLALPAVLELFAKVCDAVHAAHLRGIIHRDLKPGNILVDGQGTPYVLDFGLAKSTEHPHVESVSQPGQFIGSLPWASPEQAESRPENIDIRTDVYSLGVILYQMLTGRFPYEVVGNMRDVLDGIIKAEPVRPGTISRRINDEVETIVLKCLCKERDRRYQGAGELARDIRHYLSGEPIEARRDSTWYILSKHLRRYRWAVVAAAAVFFALVLGIIGTSWQAIRATRAQVLAKVEAERAELINEFLQSTLASGDQLRRMLVRDPLELTAARTLPPNPDFQQLIDYVAGQIPERFADHPEVEAALQHTVGSAYNGMGRIEESETHLGRALELREHLFGESAPETRATMGILAHTLGLADKAGEARSLDDRLIELTREALGPEHPETLTATGRRAFNLSLWGPPDDAAALARQTLAECRRILPADHPATLYALWASSNAHRNAGLLLEAETAARELAERAERTLPRESPLAHNARIMLAWTVARQRRLEEALLLNRQVVDESSDVWDQSHPVAREEKLFLARVLLFSGRRDEALSLIDELDRATPRDPVDALTVEDSRTISELLWIVGRKEDAIHRARETIAARQRRFDFPSRRTVWVIFLMARYLADTGAADDGESLLQKAVADCRRAHGDAGENTLAAIECLASFLIRQGQSARAEPLQRELIESLRQGSERDSVRLEDALWTMGSILASQRKCDEAEHAYREAYDIAARARGPESWDACYRKSGLAVVLRRCGRLDEAESYGRESVDGLRPFAQVLPTYFIQAAQFYASVLKSAARLDEAERILREAAALRSERVGSGGTDCIYIVSDLVDVLDRLGKPDEAIDLQRQIIESYRAVYGAEHPQALRAQINLVHLRARQSPAGMEAAIEYARSAAAATDDLSTFDLLRCGEYLVVGDDFEAAAGIIRRAIEEGGRQHWYYKSLGWALLRARRREEAHAALQQALEDHDPAGDMSTAKVDHWTAAYLLGQVGQDAYVARWQNDSEHYTRYACMTWFYVGQRLEAEGNREEAIAAYRKSAELGQLPDAFPISHFAAYRLHVLGQ